MADIPVEEVLNMKKQGLGGEEIHKKLEEKGYNLAQISEAMTQAAAKGGVEAPNPDEGGEESAPPAGMEVSELNKEEEGGGGEEIPVPSPPLVKEEGEKPEEMPGVELPPTLSAASIVTQAAAARPVVEDIQALVEEIISEKWSELVGTIGDVNIWKAKISDDTESIKQEILRMQTRFENLQAAVLGKVREYDQDIKSIGTEMKSLQKVFQKILEPLVSNVKELSRITEDLKKKK